MKQGHATIYLDDFLAAVKRSIVRSSDVLERSRLEGLREHFTTAADGSLEPLTLPFKLPAHTHAEGEGAVRVYDVPTAALAPPRAVDLDRLSMEFECLLEGLDGNGHAGGDGEPRVALIAGVTRNRWAPRVKVTLEYSAGETPEGVARINDALLKQF